MKMAIFLLIIVFLFSCVINPIGKKIVKKDVSISITGLYPEMYFFFFYYEGLNGNRQLKRYRVDSFTFKSYRVGQTYTGVRYDSE